MNALEGGCLCGALRYVSSVMPMDADYCHCRLCQRHTGAPVSAWMDFMAEQVRWHDARTLTEYASSEHVRRGFCGTCGATMSYRDTRHPTYLSLAIASLDNPDTIHPVYHIHTSSQVSWCVINDELTRYTNSRT